MTATPISTSTAAVASPERTNTPSPTPRRRGLTALRRLGPPSPGETSRLSPRSYFSRSVSSPQTPTSTPQSHPAQSSPRPNEIRSQKANKSAKQEIATRDNPSPSLTTSPAAQNPSADSSDMARHRPSTNLRGAVSEAIRNNEAYRAAVVVGDASDDMAGINNAQANGNAQESPDERSRPPTIRFFPHQELRQGRPSLTFTPIVRTLPSESSIIRVGRYSEREGIPVSNPTGPSDAPVGFKSKVVSRKHCEFSFVNGSWQIKDVSSSSGTFLNHIRLSQPNTESRLYPVKDGDIVQLGIDFRGGEEMIFRCVKIRIECNRSWQKRPNNFKYVKFCFLFGPN
jgi:E3 ubiquitin-protein ligase DMA1/2